MLGNGDGTFGPAVAVPVDTGPGEVLTTDLNDDHRPDVIVSNGLAQTVSVLLGNGDGTFVAAMTTETFGRVRGFDVGDVDLDGNVDLVFGLDDEIVVRPGNGDGTFGTGTSLSAVGENRVTAIDFNDDGKLDLVASDRGQPFNSPYTPGAVNVLLGNGDGTFLPVSRYAGPTHPTNLWFADFDGDGALDVAATEDAPFGTIGLFSVTRGDGRGGLVSPFVQIASPKVPPVANPSVIVAISADLNGDGLDDLVSLNRDPNESEPIIVQLSNGDGTLATPSLFGSGGRGPGAGEIADLNGDSIPDLVVTNLNNPRVVGVLLGIGDGSFAAADTYPLTDAPATDVTVGDVDEDGIPDLIIASARSSRVMFGNGDGTFQAPSFNFAGSFVIQTLALADFDGDNHLDVAGLQSPTLQEGIAVVFLGRGDGTFQPGKPATIGARPTSLAVADLNSDGILDIAGANAGGVAGDASLGILLGIGDGTFMPVVPYEVPGAALAIHAADYDNNGQIDLAALVTLGTDEDDTRAIALYFNVTDGTLPEPHFYHTSSSRTQAITPGDFNGDGGIDIGTANGIQNTVSIILNAVSKSGAQVDNAQLIASGSEFNPVANIEFTTTAALFTDDNPFSNVDDFSAIIDWGDGITSDGTVIAGTAGGYRIVGSHTYATTGDYSLAVNIMDAGKLSATASSHAHVSSEDQTIIASGTTFMVAEDTFFSEVVATFTDQDVNGTIHDYAATIHWSDGQISAGTIVANSMQGFDVVGMHTYALPDTYTVNVVIRSLSNEAYPVDSTVTVLDVNDPPLFTSTPNTAVAARSVYAYEIMVHDEDDADSELTIDAISVPTWLTLVDHADGTATLSGVPQRADEGTHSLELRVMDDGHASTTQSFLIVVDNFPYIDDQAFVIPENSPNGTAVGTIAVRDANATDELSFNISSGK